MAITSTGSSGTDRVKMASGSHFDDAGTDAADISLGFTPRYVRVIDVTTGTMLEWFEGMTTAHAVKTVIAGTRSAITSAGITVVGRKMGFPVATDSQYRWVAFD